MNKNPYLEFMDSLRDQAVKALNSLPEKETDNAEEMMYRIYVIDKVRKGQSASKAGQTISIEDLKKKRSKW